MWIYCVAGVSMSFPVLLNCQVHGVDVDTRRRRHRRREDGGDCNWCGNCVLALDVAVVAAAAAADLLATVIVPGAVPPPQCHIS